MHDCPCGTPLQQGPREDDESAVTAGTVTRSGRSPVDHGDAVDALGHHESDNTMLEPSTATDLARLAGSAAVAMDMEMTVAPAVAADPESLDGAEHPHGEEKSLESGGGGIYPRGNNTVRRAVAPADNSRAPPPTRAKAGDVSASPTCQRAAAAQRSTFKPSPATTALSYNELKRLVQILQQENADLNFYLEDYESDNRWLKQELHLSQRQLARVAKERHDAVHDRQRLLHELQGAVVDRTVRTTAGAFPAGDALITGCEEYGGETEFFLNDLAHAIVDRFPASSLNDPLRLAMNTVLTMLRDHFAWLKDAADQVVAAKRVQFEAFLGQGAHETANSTLVNLLWQSTMQNHVKTLIGNGLDGLISLRENGAESQQEQHEHWVVVAAEGLEMLDDGALQPNRLMKFCNSILYLDLVCRFSQPQCFLLPDIGATVPFDGKHHRQVYLCLAGETKVKEGESVHVLFPGLYFVSPTDEDGRPRRGGDGNPAVRAMVAQIIEF
jgi:hypothetical protein